MRALGAEPRREGSSARRRRTAASFHTWSGSPCAQAGVFLPSDIARPVMFKWISLHKHTPTRDGLAVGWPSRRATACEKTANRGLVTGSSQLLPHVQIIQATASPQFPGAAMSLGESAPHPSSQLARPCCPLWVLLSRPIQTELGNPGLKSSGRLSLACSSGTMFSSREPPPCDLGTPIILACPLGCLSCTLLMCRLASCHPVCSLPCPLPASPQPATSFPQPSPGPLLCSQPLGPELMLAPDISQSASASSCRAPQVEWLSPSIWRGCGWNPQLGAWAGARRGGGHLHPPNSDILQEWLEAPESTSSLLHLPSEPWLPPAGG